MATKKLCISSSPGSNTIKRHVSKSVRTLKSNILAQHMKAQSASANKEYYVDSIDNNSINCNNVDLFALLCFIVCQQLLLSVGHYRGISD